VTGSAQLANGDLQDFTLGVHLADLTANVTGSEQTIRLVSLRARAGSGTMTAEGTLDLGAPDWPIAINVTARNARPIASDLLTATIDADLSLHGSAPGSLAASGAIHVQRADITIPTKVSAQVPVLAVRRAGAPPPAPPPPPPAIALDITLDAARQIYIRGRGADVELAGSVHIQGMAASPTTTGGFHLVRGTFSLVGSELTFSEGTIDFSGAPITDPSLRLVANSQSATWTASLVVSGSARDPKISLTSVPELPQDEILAQLLFGRLTSKLSPFELAQVAAALVEISGAAPGTSDALAKARGALGLDRLSIGSSASGAPTLEAGRYLAPGVYVGARQAAKGSGSQATVQIDIAKGLQLETTAGTGTTSAQGAQSSSGASASIGLRYQFEY
jgi:translocation and assembly module TamB